MLTRERMEVKQDDS